MKFIKAIQASLKLGNKSSEIMNNFVKVGKIRSEMTSLKGFCLPFPTHGLRKKGRPEQPREEAQKDFQGTQQPQILPQATEKGQKNPFWTKATQEPWGIENQPRPCHPETIQTLMTTMPDPAPALLMTCPIWAAALGLTGLRTLRSRGWSMSWKRKCYPGIPMCPGLTLLACRKLKNFCKKQSYFPSWCQITFKVYKHRIKRQFAMCMIHCGHWRTCWEF